MTDSEYILSTIEGLVAVRHLPEIHDHMQRMETIAARLSAMDNDFPLGPACDLSGEGHCTACE